MSSEFLSVEEARAEIIRFWGEPSLRSPACLDKLISAVDREATKRERERAVYICNNWFLDCSEVVKKILEEQQ